MLKKLDEMKCSHRKEVKKKKTFLSSHILWYVFPWFNPFSPTWSTWLFCDDIMHFQTSFCRWDINLWILNVKHKWQNLYRCPLHICLWGKCFGGWRWIFSKAAPLTSQAAVPLHITSTTSWLESNSLKSSFINKFNLLLFL